MKSLEEYKKEIEQDPKARRRLKKLEKEFEAVEESLTEEELVKYGLKPAASEDAAAGIEADAAASQNGSSDGDAAASADEKTPVTDEAGAGESNSSSPAVDSGSNSPAVDSVLDVISRKI